MNFVYRLKEKDKAFLRKEPDRLVRDLKRYFKNRRYEKIIAVGDYSSLKLEQAGIQPDLSIIDGKIQRKKITREIRAEKTLKAVNPAHTITKQAWEKVKQGLCYSQSVKLKIEGEEDLLFLPSVIFSPNGSLVIYGVRNKGSGVVKVTPLFRDEIINFLRLKREKIICGGSFDRFHAGHKYFLLTAQEKAKKIFLGLTSDEYLKKKIGNEDFWRYEKRLNKVGDFLKQYDARYEILEIHDPYSKALELDGDLLVTDETYMSGLCLNKERKRIGKNPFTIIKIERIKAGDGGSLSSARIRKGEIDLNGNVLNNANGSS